MKNAVVALVAVAFVSVALAQSTTAAPAAQVAPATGQKHEAKAHAKKTKSETKKSKKKKAPKSTPSAVPTSSTTHGKAPDQKPAT